MFRYVLALGLCVFAGSAVAAADGCFRSDAEAQTAALAKAGSCRAAFAMISECAWGSSADVGFAAVVAKTCEGEFLAKLTGPARDNYAAELGLCGYEQQRQQGTMYLSAAALCRAGVAARFADNPSLADRPLPAASFDCAKARTPLEKTICADRRLGRADIVLSRVYREALKSMTPDDQKALNADERRWMAKVAADCRLADAQAGAKAADCAREAFERRFTAIGGCADEILNCVNTPE